MKKVEVKATKNYEVIIDTDILAKSGAYIKKAVTDLGTAVIVSDDNVEALYGKTVKISLEEQGFKVYQFTFPHGEESKNISTLNELWQFLAEKEITKSDIIVALGGGVTGDLSGLAAATYLRGIRFVQIPTSLLAMVDASVGGKTAIDLPQGKNLVGAFWQPSLVLCDCAALKTLPAQYLLDGWAEVIKYGFIADAELLDMLAEASEPSEEIIARCVENKRRLVEADEYDKGSRQLLNLGHTLGHAIEKCSNYQISHGQAVAIGMILIVKAAVKRGWCEKEVLAKMLAMTAKYQLPQSTIYQAEELKEAALRDKKRLGASINLVIPVKIGESRLKKIAVTELLAIIKDGLQDE